MPAAVGRAPAWLSRLGYADPQRAGRLLAAPPLGLWDTAADRPADPAAEVVLAELGRTGDPDLATLALHRLAEAAEAAGAAGAAGAAVVAKERTGLLRALREQPVLRQRLLAVLGASRPLGDHLVAHPAEWNRLAQPETRGRGVDELTTVLGAVVDGNDMASIRELRSAYRSVLVELTARDLTGAASTEQVVQELSDLAAATLRTALAMADAAAPADAGQCRLAVIALGKCGGRELNYVSDVDVVFVAEPAESVAEPVALAAATRRAAELMRICGLVAWPVDAALRPEGNAGALVRTLSSHQSYYRRWARTWEFQALLKMRPVAGDPDLGAQYVDTLWPLVWTAVERENFVADVQAMRRRVADTVPAAIAPREVKLGPGGLRDVEFAVQLLQLVHGRADATLRTGTTLVALDALSAGGYVGRGDAETLAAAYRFLRTVEHRLQLQRLRRTHLLPDAHADRRWLARTMLLPHPPSLDDGQRSTLEAFDAQLSVHAREVRRLHEKLFYRPLLHAVARVPGAELQMSAEAAGGRLGALGFSDPDGALRHLEQLTAGVSRKAAMQRLLLPAMLHILADTPAPDAGLLAYRQVSEQLGSSPWYLRLLRDEGQAAERLATLLGSSRYVADLLGRAPEALRLLASDEGLHCRADRVLGASMGTTAARYNDPAEAVRAVRALRRHELLKIACADLLEHCDIRDVGSSLSAVAGGTLRAAVDVARREAERKHGGVPTRFAVIALGRLGSGEMGYSSDADVMFVHDPVPDTDDRAASNFANAVAERVRELLGAPAPDPPLQVDAGLRPEGRNGPLVRSLASYREYYERWASVWEAQALLRAAPVAGDAELGREFTALVDPLRYPAGGLPDNAATEIRRIKARVDDERLPRGADRATHTKLGRGGLSDVEWTVQLLQLQHAGSRPSLRTTSTLAALEAAASEGLLDRDQAAALEAAWRFASRCRNAIMLVRGRPGDQLPRSGRDLVGVARAVGYPPGRDAGVFLDDYQRAARRARRVVERVFYV